MQSLIESFKYSSVKSYTTACSRESFSSGRNGNSTTSAAQFSPFSSWLNCAERKVCLMLLIGPGWSRETLANQSPLRSLRRNRISDGWCGTPKISTASQSTFIQSLVHCLWGAQNVINANLYILKREVWSAIASVENKRDPLNVARWCLLARTPKSEFESKKIPGSFFIQTPRSSLSVDYKSDISFDEISCMLT